MRQAYDGFRAMGVDPLFDADLVSAVCFNHTDPFWGDLDGILFSRFSKGKGFRFLDRKSTRLNSSHMSESRMPSSA